MHPSARHMDTDSVEVSRCDVAQLLARLGSSVDGLSAGEAQARLKEHGPNVVAQRARKSMARQLLERMLNPLNVLLLTLVCASLLVRDHRSAAVISVMVALSVGLALTQERKATRAAEKLRAMVHTTASVQRRPDEAAVAAGDGAGPRLSEVPISTLVPGDIVHVSAGDLIPADLRLLGAKDLYVNQAPLTGEAMPVEKHAEVPRAADLQGMEYPTMCFMGTSVISGTGTGVVVRTGSRAYFGAIADLTAGERATTDFDRGVSRFALLMLRFILVMAPLVFVINGVTKGNWGEALLFAMAVAVGLTPEMLPMIVTMNLSKGAIAMSRRRVIVKRLTSIQDFGAMDVLCTDKTGTLTQDRVVLEQHTDVYGKDSATTLDLAWLNSRHQSGLRNLLDVAILEHAEVEARLQGEHRWIKVDEIPFDFVRRRMSVVVQDRDGRHLLICKGAVEEVFNACTTGESDGKVFPLDAGHLHRLREVTRRLNEDGLRVIAVASRSFAGTRSVYGVADESDLTLNGYVAFLDPPKDSAAGAIAALARHGVRVKILTGDGDIVTRRICAQVGLDVTDVLLGHELEAMTPEALSARAENVQVFARLSPTQKVRVIEALHRKAHVVGFLGDGINDGPAMQAADVGISVDNAADIAKEAADIILLEKSLLVLDEGVIEGRKVFGNIVKYIRMGASSNFGNMFSVIGASAWLPFLPMAPIQVLTNNLLYDFSQTAIPTDGVDPEYLDRPRRWEIRNIARFMLFIGPISSMFDYLTYFLMYFVFGARTPDMAATFQTGWFVESLLSQTLIIHVIRTARIPFVQSRASWPLTLSSLAVCGLGAWLPYSPFASALGLTALPALYWGALGVMLLAYLGATHAMRAAFQRRFGVD